MYVNFPACSFEVGSGCINNTPVLGAKSENSLNEIPPPTHVKTEETHSFGPNSRINNETICLSPRFPPDGAVVLGNSSNSSISSLPVISGNQDSHMYNPLRMLPLTSNRFDFGGPPSHSNSIATQTDYSIPEPRISHLCQWIETEQTKPHQKSACTASDNLGYHLTGYPQKQNDKSLTTSNISQLPPSSREEQEKMSKTFESTGTTVCRSSDPLFCDKSIAFDYLSSLFRCMPSSSNDNGQPMSHYSHRKSRRAIPKLFGADTPQWIPPTFTYSQPNSLSSSQETQYSAKDHRSFYLPGHESNNRTPRKPTSKCAVVRVKTVCSTQQHPKLNAFDAMTITECLDGDATLNSPVGDGSSSRYSDSVEPMTCHSVDIIKCPLDHEFRKPRTRENSPNVDSLANRSHHDLLFLNSSSNQPHRSQSVAYSASAFESDGCRGRNHCELIPDESYTFCHDLMTRSVVAQNWASRTHIHQKELKDSYPVQRKPNKSSVIRSQSYRSVNNRIPSHDGITSIATDRCDLPSLVSYQRSISEVDRSQVNHTESLRSTFLSRCQSVKSPAMLVQDSLFYAEKGRTISGSSPTNQTTERVNPLCPNLSSSAIFERIDLQPWFHFNLSRAGAERILNSSRVGSFLVRCSETSGSKYSLSIRRENDVLHMKISRDSHSSCYVLGEYSQPYPSIAAMIHRYTRHLLPVRGTTPILLRFPINRSNLS